MAKTLDKDRPKSTIADMIDGGLVEQATQETAKPVPTAAEMVAPDMVPMLVIPGAGTVPQRTGERSDIQKMYRLTPAALRTVQELSMNLSSNLGFEIKNSAVIRSILRVIHQALPDICQLTDDGLTPHRQPSTAIGNEHTRDAIESEVAHVITRGILRHASETMQIKSR